MTKDPYAPYWQFIETLILSTLSYFVWIHFKSTFNFLLLEFHRACKSENDRYATYWYFIETLILSIFLYFECSHFKSTFNFLLLEFHMVKLFFHLDKRLGFSKRKIDLYFKWQCFHISFQKMFVDGATEKRSLILFTVVETRRNVRSVEHEKTPVLLFKASP